MSSGLRKNQPECDDVRSGELVHWMLLVAVVLALFGAFGSWLQFPLTGSLRAPMLSGPLDTPLLHSQGALLVVIVAVLVVAWLRGIRWLLVGCGLALLALAGVFFVDLIAGDQGWLVRFVVESGQRGALQGFTKKLYWPNLNPEPTVTLVSEFEHLWERLRATWSAVGMGWLHTVAAGGLILVAVAARSRPYSILTLLGTLSVALGIAAIGYPLVDADMKHREGDAHLASGRPRAALLAYKSALGKDPILAESRPFLVKASYAYLMLLGESSDLAAVYLAHIRKTGAPNLKLTPQLRQQMANAHRRLAHAVASADASSSLEGAIRRQAIALDAQLWLTQGLMALNANAPGEARQAFRQVLAKDPMALESWFFLGHTELLLGMRQHAVTTLIKALALVQNAAIRADVACTLGDALREEKHLTAARSQYDRCLELDDVFNFRAVRSLGGT